MHLLCLLFPSLALFALALFVNALFALALFTLAKVALTGFALALFALVVIARLAIALYYVQASSYAEDECQHLSVSCYKDKHRLMAED